MIETKAVMAQEEFEQHHSRTWDYVARVGKIWEAIAGEQQAIVDGRGYRYLGYASHEDYWNGEFAERSGWTYRAIKNWLSGRRVKLATVSTESRAGLYEDLGPTQWTHLQPLTPIQRSEFLDQYESTIKPKLQEEGVNTRVFQEAVKEFRGERKTGVIEQMHEEGVPILDYPAGPTPEEEAYNAASQLLSVAMDVTPEAAADSVSPGLAQTTAQRYEALIPWTRRFVAQLYLRANGAGRGR